MEFKLGEAVEVLRNTPAVLRAMLAGLSEPWIRNKYGPDTFSPFDVVGHLIHGERTDWIPRTKVILEHGPAKTFESFDRFAMYEDSKGKALAELLDTFEQLRCQNLDTLQSLRLTPRSLSLKGRHPELGEVTLGHHLATWVVHDLNHIHQIAKCLAWQYREAIGPWRGYVGVLGS